MRNAIIFLIGILASIAGGFIFHYLAKQSVKNSKFASAGLVFLTVIGFIVLYDSQEIDVKLAVAISSRATTDLLTPFMVGGKNKGEDVLSPINFLLFMSIVNTQEKQSRIISFRVEGAENTGDPWITLGPVPLDTRTDNLYVLDLNSGVRKGARLTLENGNLHDLFQKRGIFPSETVNGWALFERLDVDPESIKFFKVHLRDTAGVEASKILQTDKNPTPASAGKQNEMIFGQAVIRLEQRDIDLSHFLILPHYSYYRD